MRKFLYVGYSFLFKGEHCKITKCCMRWFEYSTLDKPNNNYMDYSFFQQTPHYKSKNKEYGTTNKNNTNK